MSATPAMMIKTVRVFTGLSGRQMAALSGVASSTISRIERGDLVPTTDMLARILDAAGWTLQQEMIQRSDPVAGAAARAILDPESGLGTFSGVDVWIEKYRSIGLVDRDGKYQNRRDLLIQAGSWAGLAKRPGIMSVAREGTWPEIASRIKNTGVEWAATGGAAANRVAQSANSPWPVFYVSDPEAVIEIAGFGPRPSRGPSVSLIPFDGIANVGVEEDGSGYQWVDSLQVVIDCFGGSGRMPQQAEVLVELLESELLNV